MKRDEIFTVAVHNPQRTGPSEAGNFRFPLQEGGKVVAFANTFLWDHDRGLYDAMKEFLTWYKPNVVLILGRFLHDEAFQRMAPRRFRSKDRHPVPPEVQAAHDSSQIWEERVMALGRAGGDELRSLRNAAGPQCHIAYIPAAQGQTPTEAGIKTIIESTLKQISAWRKSDPALADMPFPTLPLLPDEYHLLLGLPAGNMLDERNQERIFVLPFGAAATLECLAEIDGVQQLTSKVRFEIGNNRLTNPGSAAYRAVWHNGLSTVRGYDGKIASGWFTKLQDSLGMRRLHLFFSEVGNMLDSERLGSIDTGQWLWSKGFFAGAVTHGFLHGQTFPFKRRDAGCRDDGCRIDDCRTAVIFGKVVREAHPSGFGRQGTILIS